jgi:mannose-6-phosphate isomerase-like protein (cupin superfamily)
MSGKIFEDPVQRYRYRFEPQEGDLLRIEVWAEPGGGVSIEHFHPRTEERWEILMGEVTFKVDGEKRTAGPGERVVAPPRARHSFENTGPTEAHMRVEAEPAQDLQAFLEEAAALAQAGMYTRKGRPRGFRGIVQGAAFAERHKQTTVVTSPPPVLQRILFPPLARLARRFS